MFATLATFQPPMFSLKEGRLANSWYMLLTALVSQLVIGPYIDAVVNGFSVHEMTAAAIFAFVRATIASEGSGSRKTPSATAQTAACMPTFRAAGRFSGLDTFIYN